MSVAPGGITGVSPFITAASSHSGLCGGPRVCETDDNGISNTINAVAVMKHNLVAFSAAKWTIDLGDGGDGKLVATGSPEDITIIASHSNYYKITTFN
jgi:hypothetical protein